MITTGQILHCTLFALLVLLLPIFTVGTIRKTKARLQNRMGPPIFQPLFDLLKLLKKGETVSKSVSYIFRSTSAINLSVLILVALLLPWMCSKPNLDGADLFLVIYLMSLSRLFTLLAALDSGSAFGAFGASREASLSLLVEPSMVLALISLSLLSHTSDLTAIFSYSNVALINKPGLWLLVGTALFLCSLVELSRMPVDDPTTHLELTMVHEAMILEASGRNLALLEFSHALRMTILFGLVAQCYMHAVPYLWQTTDAVRLGVSLICVLSIACFVGVLESILVKLQWVKIPNFIAYSLTMSLLAGCIAVGGGLSK